MIKESLSKAGKYYAQHPLFRAAFDFIQNVSLADWKDGRVEIKGSDLYAIFATNQMKKKADAPLETHMKYVDIQVPLDTVEEMGFRESASLKSPKAPYDEAKDIQFFSDPPARWISVRPGEFVIFYPSDAHAPCVGEGSSRKIVIKAKV